MIVAGEASGDLHGSRLVAAMRKQRPGLSFTGMGGPELKRAGVELLFDAARVSVVAESLEEKTDQATPKVATIITTVSH